ncbi:Transcription factor MafB [Oopsacas minuta]|uniref:Transcription factor MafB n=1 Tax=Oopsacas minuta TaxID=111878 RepID=A0AAV7JVN8_9METZ|nr:Transcription factor MafB [Oopsacas minuta]
MDDLFDPIDILGNVDMPLSHQNITNLDIKVLNKLLQKEGFTKEEASHIKETRRRSKMKEYSRKRRQKEVEEIEYLEIVKAELVREFENIRKEIYFLKKQKTKYKIL